MSLLAANSVSVISHMDHNTQRGMDGDTSFIDEETKPH